MESELIIENHNPPSNMRIGCKSTHKFRILRLPISQCKTG